MKQPTLVPDKEDLLTAVNQKLVLIVNAFTAALYLAGMLVLVGVLLKLLHVTGEQVVFVFAMSLLSFLFLLQTGISFVYVFARMKLAFLGAFTSLSISLTSITLIFAFEGWWGTHIMLVLTLPLLVVSIMLLSTYFATGLHRHTTHRKFLYQNILGPCLFILLLWLVYLIRHEVRERRDGRLSGPATRLEIPAF